MRKLKKSIGLNELLEALDIPIVDKYHQILINSIGSISLARDGLLSFSTNKIISNETKGIIFAPIESIKSPSIIQVSNPRLAFAKALAFIFKNIGLKQIYSGSIPKDLYIGTNVKIGHGVVIGNNVRIGNNVVINEFVKIGDRCSIKSGAVIGEDGFGFERDDDGTPVRFPHIGNVLIENDVEIGSMSTVNRGTLGSTVIKESAKIDDHVHIAHNVFVDESALICAGSIIGGSSYIGKRCWLGINSTIHQKIKIEDDAIVGMGANVFKSIKCGLTVAGFPSKNVPKIN